MHCRIGSLNINMADAAEANALPIEVQNNNPNIQIQYPNNVTTASQDRNFFDATLQESPTQELDMEIEQQLKRRRPVNESDDSFERTSLEATGTDKDIQEAQARKKGRTADLSNNKGPVQRPGVSGSTIGQTTRSKPQWKPFNVAAPPINDTLASSGQGKVILITPEPRKAKDLINNPIEVTEMLDKGVFGKIDVEDVRINKRKLIITVQIKDPTDAIIQEILATEKLGDWNIHCSIPNSDKFKYGVISPVHQSTDIEKIQDMIYIQMDGGPMFCGKYSETEKENRSRMD